MILGRLPNRPCPGDALMRTAADSGGRARLDPCPSFGGSTGVSSDALGPAGAARLDRRNLGVTL